MQTLLTITLIERLLQSFPSMDIISRAKQSTNISHGCKRMILSNRPEGNFYNLMLLWMRLIITRFKTFWLTLIVTGKPYNHFHSLSRVSKRRSASRMRPSRPPHPARGETLVYGKNSFILCYLDLKYIVASPHLLCNSWCGPRSEKLRDP